MENLEQNSDVINKILEELENLKSMYKKWSENEDSFTSLEGVYKHKASGVDDAIKILKKYCS